MKKILLFIFVFVFLSNPVNAATFKDVAADVPYIDEIDYLSSLGIMQGANQNFRPNDTITRAEFVTVLCRALQLNTNDVELEKQPGFPDVKPDSWALPYINAAVKNGIVKGFNDGTFRPNQPVTNEQVIKMIVAGWGYSEEAEKLGGYPNGYFEIAKRYGITNEVLFNYKTDSKRFIVAMFTYKALSMPLAGKESISEGVVNEPIDKIPNKDEQSTKPILEQTAVDDPIQILRTVTPESARFERTVFEQPWDLKKAPFYIQNNSFIYKHGTSDKNANISVFGDGKTILLSQNMVKNTVKLSLPAGRWRFVFYTSENHIKDDYYGYINVDSSGKANIEKGLWRYTYLKIQPNVIEEVLNINSLRETFLIATAEKSDKGDIVFTFETGMLHTDRRLTIGIDDETSTIFGKDEKVNVSFVLPVRESYRFQSTIIDNKGQETIKGDIKFDLETGEVLFEGDFHKFTTLGWVFVD